MVNILHNQNIEDEIMILASIENSAIDATSALIENWEAYLDPKDTEHSDFYAYFVLDDPCHGIQHELLKMNLGIRVVGSDIVITKVGIALFSRITDYDVVYSSQPQPTLGE
ncbi:MAG: hypothetical protein WCJ24_02065 [Candidatus Saccharibacteria bacterium]